MLKFSIPYKAAVRIYILYMLPLSKQLICMDSKPSSLILASATYAAFLFFFM